MTGHSIHDAAATGYQIAGDAYERGRPEYPAIAVARLSDVLGLAAGRTVVDVGAGTGKLTRLLASTGATIIAVEPVEGMRRKFKSLLPEIDVREGTAESLPLAQSSVEAVTVAQAFHWFDGDPALRELHRVLKPTGALGLIWNSRDESLDWVAELTQLIDRHEGGAPRYRTGRWREAFDRSTLFTPLETAQFFHVQPMTPSMVVDRVASVSFISALPAHEKLKVADGVRDLLAHHPMTKGLEEIDLRYRTDVYWCQPKKG